MTVAEFMEYREYIQIHEDMKYASDKDHEKEIERMNRGS